MPKITIKTLPLDEHIDVSFVIQGLGRAIEEELRLPAGRFVIIWEFIRPHCFLYEGKLAGSQPKASHHPIVDITAVKGLPDDIRKGLVQVIVKTLASGLDMAEDNICVSFTWLEKGDLFIHGEYK